MVVNVHYISVEVVLQRQLDQPLVLRVSDTTTIVGLGNEILDGLPGNGSLAVISLNWLSVLVSSHVVGKGVGTHLEIRVIEWISIVPTKGLELLPLKQQCMEPAQTKQSLSECHLLINLNKALSNVSVKTSHVGLNSTRRLNGHLDRSLE